MRLLTGDYLPDTPILHRRDLLLPGLARQARREFVARVLVAHRAGGIDLGEALRLARHGRIHY
eukprot:12271650-Alexandrium_andersonii.AAC.1